MGGGKERSAPPQLSEGDPSTANRNYSSGSSLSSSSSRGWEQQLYYTQHGAGDQA